MRKFFTLFVLAVSLTGMVGCGKKTKRDNVEPPAELTEFTPSLQVQRVWKSSLGKGERRLWLRQHPASDGSAVYAADLKGKLQALGATDGVTKWKVDTGLRLSGSPAIGEGTLAIGTLDGEVVAYNPDSGTERWRAKVSSEVIAAPLIARGLVIARAIDGRVFAFAATDGERKWVHDHGTPALTLRGNSSPVLAEGLVVIGYDNGEIVALRLEDGIQAWGQPIAFGEGRTELERMVDIDGELAYSRGEIFAAAFNAQVAALSLQGQPLWNREMSSYAGITVTNDRLLVADRDGTLWALDRNSGAAQWKQDMLSHRWLTTPVVHGSHVVVGDMEGYLHWFDLETGELAARQRLDKKPIRATPQVSGDMLYAVSIEGELGAYRN